MSNLLTQEVRAFQNPALGAGLLWRVVVGYHEKGNGGAAVLPLLFFALPILMHQESLRILQTTQAASGLSKFVEKFHESKESRTDELLGL